MTGRVPHPWATIAQEADVPERRDSSHRSRFHRALSALLVASLLAGLPVRLNAQAQVAEEQLHGDDPAVTVLPDGRRMLRFHTDGEQQKYVRFTQTTGWPGGVVHWRYNDANRPAGIVGSAATMISLIQAGMAKWSAVCNIQFIYDGTSSNAPSLANTTQTFDGVNVVGWLAQTAPQTGNAGIGWSNPPDPGPTIEGDIAFNYTYNPDINITIVHEVGHFIGLQHSDVSNVVMSGPPLTSYVAQANLQADDIAGCVAIYGPAASPPSISGTISNGGGISGVQFCARPSAGVTCNVSNASGAYSCTVPSGWTGTLHSPRVGGNRIPPQVFGTGVTSATTRNVAAKTHAGFSCDLDIDNNGLFEADIDGLAIMRRALGFGQASMTGLSGACAATTSAANLFTAANPANFDITGGNMRATTDAEVAMRAMRGFTGTAVTNGLGLGNESGAMRTAWGNGADGQIRAWLNTNCGTDFQ